MQNVMPVLSLNVHYILMQALNSIYLNKWICLFREKIKHEWMEKLKLIVLLSTHLSILCSTLEYFSVTKSQGIATEKWSARQKAGDSIYLLFFNLLSGNVLLANFRWKVTNVFYIAKNGFYIKDVAAFLWHLEFKTHSFCVDSLI